MLSAADLSSVTSLAGLQVRAGPLTACVRRDPPGYITKLSCVSFQTMYRSLARRRSRTGR